MRIRTGSSVGVSGGEILTRFNNLPWQFNNSPPLLIPPWQRTYPPMYYAIAPPLGSGNWGTGWQGTVAVPKDITVYTDVGNFNCSLTGSYTFIPKTGAESNLLAHNGFIVSGQSLSYAYIGATPGYVNNPPYLPGSYVLNIFPFSNIQATTYPAINNSGTPAANGRVLTGLLPLMTLGWRTDVLSPNTFGVIMGNESHYSFVLIYHPDDHTTKLMFGFLNRTTSGGPQLEDSTQYVSWKQSLPVLPVTSIVLIPPFFTWNYESLPPGIQT